jgi:hypothetical protein
VQQQQQQCIHCVLWLLLLNVAYTPQLHGKFPPEQPLLLLLQVRWLLRL